VSGSGFRLPKNNTMTVPQEKAIDASIAEERINIKLVEKETADILTGGETVVEAETVAEGAEKEKEKEKENKDGDEKELIAAGTQALALSRFEEAAEKLAMAVEAQVNNLGPLAVEVAPTFHLYGRALFHSAVQKSSVFGEKAEQVNPAVEAASSSTSAAVAPPENFVFQGDGEEEEEEEDTNEDETQNLQDIEIPMSDDLELAWENLENARIIYEKENRPEHNLALADVHISLGDVSLESENFEEAIKDYQIALDMKKKVAPGNFRELAEAHFKLALAFEYSELNEQSIDEVKLAMSSLAMRIVSLKKQFPEGKGKEPAGSDTSEVSREIEELHGFLAELKSKETDLNALLIKEDNGESISAAPINTVNLTKAVDVSSLVKKRPMEQQPSEKKSKHE